MYGKSLSAMRRLAAYALPALLVLIIFLFSITHVHRTMRQEAARRSQDTTAFLTDYLESQLINTESTASAYLSSRLPIQLSGLPEEHAADDDVRHSAYALSADIMTFCNRNNLAKDLLFYFPKLNRIVGKNGYLTPYQYYKSLYPQDTGNAAGYLDWMEQTLGRTGVQFLTYCDAATGTVSAYHFQSIPVNAAAADCDRVLLLMIDEQAVQTAVMELARSMDLHSLELLTDSGLPYCVWQRGADETQGAAIRASTESTVWRMRVEISQTLSSAYGAVYTLERTLLICLLASAALALLVSAYFFIRNSRSLQKIRSILPAEDAPYHTTDFEWIAEKVDQLYQENIHQIEEIDLQNEMLAHALLRSLLDQNVSHFSQAEQLCNAYGVTLEYQNLKLLTAPVSIRYEQLQWTMHELLNEWESNDFWFCWTRFEENCVILCNWSSGFTRLDEFISGGVNVRLGVQALASDTFFAPEEIAERFARLYAGSGRRSAAPAPRPPQQRIPEQFLDALELGSYKKARALLPELEKWAADAVGSKRALCRRYAFLAQLYDTAPSLSEEELDQLTADYTGKTWGSILYRCLLRLSSGESVKKVSIPVLAREIIDCEYGDVQLGLASIADRLGISQPYLSRVFKEEYSEGISTVLNRRRIEAAKELMLAGDGNLKEIAAKVGFTSDMNFIRVFKKFETVTPGVYRKDAKQDKS